MVCVTHVWAQASLAAHARNSTCQPCNSKDRTANWQAGVIWAFLGFDDAKTSPKPSSTAPCLSDPALALPETGGNNTALTPSSSISHSASSAGPIRGGKVTFGNERIESTLVLRSAMPGKSA